MKKASNSKFNVLVREAQSVHANIRNQSQISLKA